MGDIISRKKLIDTIAPMVGIYEDDGFYINYERVLKIIIDSPTAEPTIDDIAERISNTDWYHIFKGELRHGAHDREEALFKAEDIFNVLKDMGASDEYTD